MIRYADTLRLGQPYVPATGIADLSAAVLVIQNDPKLVDFAQRYDVPDDMAAQRKWVQAMLTMRPTGVLPKAIADAMDRILQAELAEKTITVARDLARLDTSYPASPRVSIWNGDIATLKIGAVTNAANSQMLGCFQPFHACIDNVIQCGAGPQLREDCAKIIALQGHDEPTGEAKITRAYNLPSDFVIHTVGPIVLDHRPTPQHAEELARCYSSTLSLAAQKGVNSVAFCGISTGLYGYPADEAAQIALKSVSDWFFANPHKIDHVVFNTYGTEATEIYERTTESWT